MLRRVKSRSTLANASLTPVCRQVMPLVERVLDKSNALVTAEAKSAIGTGARDLIAKIEGTVQGVDAKVRRRCAPVPVLRGALES